MKRAIICILSVLIAASGLFVPQSRTRALQQPSEPGQIAFVSTRDGNEEIYIMNGDGSQVTRLTDDPAQDTTPAWSPKGDQLAFLSDREGVSGLYVMDAEGKSVTRVSRAREFVRSYTWGPDGKSLAYVVQAKVSRTLSIYTTDTVGGDPKLVTGDSQASCGDPAWSQDGSQLAFACGSPGIVNQPNVILGGQVFTAKLDGSNRKQLTPPDEISYTSPEWSPDGKQIVFAKSSSLQNGTDSGIFVSAIDGSQIKRLTAHAGDGRPKWSPDGTKIAFTSTQDTGNDIYLVNPDGKSLLLLINGVPRSEIAWAPDSSHLVFSYPTDGQNNPTSYNLFAIQSDGKGLTRLTNSTATDFQPVWSNQPSLALRYTVSGQILDDNHQPLFGVSVTSENGHKAITDSHGVYRLPNLAAGSHTITPELGGYTFEPKQQIINLTANAPTVDYAAQAAPGIHITQIEVMQAVQEDQSSDPFPYIQGKPTLVRIYADCGKGCQSKSGVKALLHGYDANDRDLGTLNLNHSRVMLFNKDWKEEQGDLGNTFNFILPKEWLNGELRLVAEVDGIKREKIVRFQPSKQLRIAWLPVDYVTASDPNNPQIKSQRFSPDPATMQNALADLLALYPLSADNVEYVPQLFYHPVTQSQFVCPAVDGGEGCPAVMDYLNPLTVFWERMNREGLWVGDLIPDRLFGWIPYQARGDDACGIADAMATGDTNTFSHGRIALGVDQCVNLVKQTSGGMTLARELGFLKDPSSLRTTPSESSVACRQSVPNTIGYPEASGLPLGSIGGWGIRFDQFPYQLYDPAKTYDFMALCSPDWISGFNYRNLSEGFSGASLPQYHVFLAGPGLAAPVPNPNRIGSSEQVLISGTIDSSFKVTLQPMYVISSNLPPSPPGDGPFCLEMRDDQGQALESNCLNPQFRHPESGVKLPNETFVLSMPYHENARALVALQAAAEGQKELTRVEASANKPEVKLVSPNGSESWANNQNVTIQWQGKDADGTALHYSVSYSPDDGTSWNPLILDTQDSQLIVDASALPGSATARIRVQASDGFNTASDISDAGFSVANKTPIPVILTPNSSAVIPDGQPVWLTGYGSDAEDGVLKGDALRWNSDRDGDLGTGGQILVNLSQGEHIIRLTANDRNGQNSGVSLKVSVDVTAAAAQVTAAPEPESKPGGSVKLPVSLPQINLQMPVIPVPVMLGGVGLLLLLFILLLFILIRRGIRARKVTEDRLASATTLNTPEEPKDQPATIEPKEKAVERLESVLIPQNIAPPASKKAENNVQQPAPVIKIPEAPVKPLPTDPSPAAASTGFASVSQRPVESLLSDEERQLSSGIEDVKAGRVAEGYKRLRSVLELNPQNREAWLWLGMAAARQREYVTAQRCLERALQLGHPNAEQALQWLEKNQK